MPFFPPFSIGLLPLLKSRVIIGTSGTCLVVLGARGLKYKYLYLEVYPEFNYSLIDDDLYLYFDKLLLVRSYASEYTILL